MYRTSFFSFSDKEIFKTKGEKCGEREKEKERKGGNQRGGERGRLRERERIVEEEEKEEKRTLRKINGQQKTRRERRDFAGREGETESMRSDPLASPALSLVNLCCGEHMPVGVE